MRRPQSANPNAFVQSDRGIWEESGQNESMYATRSGLISQRLMRRPLSTFASSLDSHLVRPKPLPRHPPDTLRKPYT